MYDVFYSRIVSNPLMLMRYEGLIKTYSETKYCKCNNSLKAEQSKLYCTVNLSLDRT